MPRSPELVQIPAMSSVDHLRRFVGERLTAAAEEIFGVFHKTIVQYEEEIERQRKLLDVAWEPEIKLRRIELPLQHVSKEEEVLAEQQQQLWNQEGNSGLDKEEPGPLQMKEEQEELCSSPLRLKQENQGLMLTCGQSEDQTESAQESKVEMPVITSVVSEATGEQQLSDGTPAAESQDQNEGKHKDLGPMRDTGKEVKNDRYNSHTTIGNNSSALGTDFKTGAKSFRCDICGKDFKQKAGLHVHMRTHTGERPYTCNTCGRGFVQNCTLRIHLKTHTGERPFVCKSCGKTYTTRGCLAVHIQRAHITERPYVCKTCGKGFRVRYDLISHMKIHSGEKPHVCKTCGKGFTHRSNLTQHYRTHTGEKPYLCKTCGKAFRSNSSLKDHHRLHEKLYFCKTCEEAFSHSGELLKHMKIHTGERPFICKTCGKGYTRNAHLKKHSRVHTG